MSWSTPDYIEPDFDDLKERLKISVQELYKRTLSPSYED